MALANFLSAVKQAAAKYAPEYGLDPAVLEYALIAAASLEGGLNETAGIGDGGYSVGRFQFNMNNGHGTTLLNQGYTPEQIADDEFQAWHWAPLMAQSLISAPNIATAIYNLERPAAFYPADRLASASQMASSITGKSFPIGSGGASTLPPEYAALREEYDALDAKASAAQWYIDNLLPVPAELDITAAERLRLEELARTLDKMEEDAGVGQDGGPTSADVISAYDFYNRNNPDAIAADDAAARYARDLDAINQAGAQARQALSDQTQRAQDYQTTFAANNEAARQGLASGPNPAANTRKYSGDELLAKSLEKIKANLPDVPNRPAPSLPPGGPEGLINYGRIPVGGAASPTDYTPSGSGTSLPFPNGAAFPVGSPVGPSAESGVQMGDVGSPYMPLRKNGPTGFVGSIIEDYRAALKKPKQTSAFRIPAGLPQRIPTEVGKKPKFIIRPQR